MKSNTLLKDKILLTGGTGFLGSTLAESLIHQGYHVCKLGRLSGNDIKCDLVNEVPILEQQFDIVIHNAGKAHTVPKTKEERRAFFDVNVTGTRNLLNGIKNSGYLPKSLIFISSIAVYGCEAGEDIDENHPLNASDPYGMSKIDAEKLLQEWCTKNLVSLTILRLPLLAGKNPPGNLRSMIRGIRSRIYVSISGGIARKSIVMVRDVAEIISQAAACPGIYNLTDGHHPSFYELESVIADQLRTKRPVNIPTWTAKCIGIFGDILDKIFPGKSPITSSKIKKITSTLTFCDAKARRVLGWKPHRVIDNFKIE